MGDIWSVHRWGQHIWWWGVFMGCYSFGWVVDGFLFGKDGISDIWHGRVIISVIDRGITTVHLIFSGAPDSSTWFFGVQSRMTDNHRSLPRVMATVYQPQFHRQLPHCNDNPVALRTVPTCDRTRTTRVVVRSIHHTYHTCGAKFRDRKCVCGCWT